MSKSFYKFLDRLPYKDKIFYSLLAEYHSKYDSCKTKEEGVDVSNFYENLLNEFLYGVISEEVTNEETEDESIKEEKEELTKEESVKEELIKEEKVGTEAIVSGINAIDEKFDEKLGEWGSSFSDEE
jgi:hypothetical protein